MGEIRVVIDDVLTNWVDASDETDDGPRLIPGTWDLVLRVVDIGITREEAGEYEAHRQVFRLAPVVETANG